MVVEKLKDGSWKGHGERDFHAAPRVSEHVEFDNGEIYEVVAVIHPLNASPNHAGDLILRHVSETLAFRKTL